VTILFCNPKNLNHTNIIHNPPKVHKVHTCIIKKIKFIHAGIFTQGTERETTLQTAFSATKVHELLSVSTNASIIRCLVCYLQLRGSPCDLKFLLSNFLMVDFLGDRLDHSLFVILPSLDGDNSFGGGGVLIFGIADNNDGTDTVVNAVIADAT
jgi:hypothetical protein